MKIKPEYIINIKKTLSKRRLFTSTENVINNQPKLPLLESDLFSSLDKYAEKYKYGMKSDFIPSLKEFITKTGKYKNTDFIDIAGNGGLSIVFEIENNQVIKLTKENPFEYRKHFPILDVPLIDIDKFKDFYIVREAKAKQAGLTNLHMETILKKIKKCKLEPSRDFSSLEQIGLIGNEPFLLDTRCAMPRPNKFSRFVYDFKEKHRKIVLLCKPNYNAPISHIDETPRANLSLKEGSSILLDTIKENICDYLRFIKNKG